MKSSLYRLLYEKSYLLRQERSFPVTYKTIIFKDGMVYILHRIIFNRFDRLIFSFYSLT